MVAHVFVRETLLGEIVNNIFVTFVHIKCEGTLPMNGAQCPKIMIGDIFGGVIWGTHR